MRGLSCPDVRAELEAVMQDMRAHGGSGSTHMADNIRTWIAALAALAARLGER